MQFADGTVTMWSQPESSLDAEVCSDLMSGVKSEKDLGRFAVSKCSMIRHLPASTE